jgi:AAA ATPase domain
VDSYVSHPASELVGRADELGRVAALLADAEQSAGSCHVVIGEVGVGKTALLEAAEEAATGFAVLRTRGVESDAELPFAGMVELFRPVVQLLEVLPAPQRAALEVALAIRTGVPADRLTLGAATLNLLTADAEERPLLVLVDDFTGSTAPRRKRSCSPRAGCLPTRSSC